MKLAAIASIFCLTFFLPAFHSQAQDISVEDTSKPIEEEEEFVLTDPYKLTFKIRPLSYLLLPLSAGRIGAFNGRLDYAFTRFISAGLEGEYFYIRPIGTSQLRSNAFMIRAEASYYVLKESNPDRYGEGLHIGPYYKFVHTDAYDPTFPNGITTQVYNTHILGGQIGYQWVKGKNVLDQTIGFGLGLSNGNIGLRPAFDFRLGLSFGTVILR
jgi:hypothetical protein